MMIVFTQSTAVLHKYLFREILEYSRFSRFVATLHAFVPPPNCIPHPVSTVSEFSSYARCQPVSVATVTTQGSNSDTVVVS